MMEQQSGDIGEAARLWVIRVHDASFVDWDRLTEWLESDPAHLPAYEAALDTDVWAADIFAASPPVAVMTAPAPALRRGRWFAGGAVAAAMLAVIGGWSMLRQGAPVQQVATAAGEHRTFALADGSRVMLNSDTRISFDPATPRQIDLVRGEALFDVRHDANHPFVVVADGTRLVDVGTVFNVVRDGGALDVAVASGAVDYESGSRRLRLNQGEALSRPDKDASPVLRKTSQQGVGSWQTGLLQYDDAPLDQVARDLGRNLGRPVRVANGAARLRFTGTIVLRGAPDEVLARAGPLLGVQFASNGEGWTMSPTHGPLH